MAAIVPIAVAADEQPSKKLRQIQKDLRAVVAEDQQSPELAASTCEALHRIEDQLDRVAGLQELFEWYLRMP